MSATLHGLSTSLSPTGRRAPLADHPSPRARLISDGADRASFIDKLGEGAVASFVAAGAILLASLVLGSSGSLLLIDSGVMRTAIENAFLSVGLRAIGATLIVGVVAIAAIAGWRALRR